MKILKQVEYGYFILWLGMDYSQETYVYLPKFAGFLEYKIIGFSEICNSIIRS